MSAERPTIADVARLAGVSVGTASNVFNGKGKHTEATCARVRAAAAELHFTPNALIRSLQRGKTNTIGALTWGFPGEPEPGDVGSLLLKGISDGIAEAGFDMLLYFQHARPGALRPSLFLDGRVDGVVLRPGALSYEDLVALGASRVPAVVMYERPVPDSVGSVAIDNVGGLAALMDHLVELGHRRIGFYGPAGPFDFVERLRGYREGLERHGLTSDPEDEFLTIGDVYRLHIDEACRRFLDRPDPVTAIFAGDDVAAYLFLKELDRLGVRVPEEVSVAGFNDTPVAHSSLGLTTVRQPVIDVGRTAARFVAEMVEGKTPEKCQALLPTQLVVRETTAPPGRVPTHAAVQMSLSSV